MVAYRLICRADETGATFEYLPYGEEFTLTAEDREKFATYTRSSVTGLDFAQQRWYDSVHGGFITPDRARRGISTRTPLSWNAYAYVQGDPINLNDPTGRFDDIPGDFCDLDPLDPSCMCLGDDLLDRDCLDQSSGGGIGIPQGPGQAPYQAPPTRPCAGITPSSLNFFTPRKYKYGWDSPYDHIITRHVIPNTKPGTTTYVLGSNIFGVANFTTTMQWVINMDKATFATPMAWGSQGNGNYYFDLTYPTGTSAFGFTLQGIGQDQDGNWLNTNVLVVEDNCTTVVTSYPTKL